MTLAKFLLSGIGTITIFLIGSPIVMMYPLKEKATGFAVVASSLAEAIFSPLFWVAAILLLLFFWYTSQLSSTILRLVLFWIPSVFAILVGGTVFGVVHYALVHRPR